MATPFFRNASIAIVVLLFLAGCEKPQEVTQTTTLQPGFWQATITVPGGEIETAIELSNDKGKYQASLVNGQERVRIREVSYANGELLLRFPAFNNDIRATLTGGNLEGELTIVRRHGEKQVMPFSATPGNVRRAESETTTRHDLSGRWQVRFHEPDGSDTASIGEFAQRGSRLFGTFLNPNGDHRFLAGHVRGDRFKLSTFDGAHAFLFSGEIDSSGSIRNADFWSATNWHQKWSASRNASMQLPDAYSRTWLKPGYERFEFAFPDPDGNIVSLDDDRFAGKVVIVTIAGTWCPNCNDEARFMAPVHKQYRDRGLEVVALLFEHFEEHELAAEQARQFALKFGIEYDTLIAGISDKAEAGKVLPSLSAILAFPTTIFIDRSGRVRHIHAGFTGPGTGEHYEKLQRDFRARIEALLDEPADLIGTLITDDASTGDEPSPGDDSTVE